MREYLPIFIVLGIIGIFTLGFIAAYVREKHRKDGKGQDRNIPDGEIMRRLMVYAKPYWKEFLLGFFLMILSNVYALVSPLLVAALCMGRRQLRFFLFCIAGMGVCLLSAYINTFLAAVCQADALAATAEIAPVVEEMMKLLPLVFYLLVFEPEGDKIKAAAITIALAFATFENVCYLIQNGADRFSFIFFRGFGTGAMHVLCGLIVGGGLAYTWQRTWLKIAGTCGLLGAAITLHAIYNLLIAYGGAAQYVAYALPVLLVAAGKLSAFRLSRRK